MFCRKCGTEIDMNAVRRDGTVECPGCGTVYRTKSATMAPKPEPQQLPDKTENQLLSSKMMFCKKCGTELSDLDRRSDGSVECPGCGAIYRSKASSRPAPVILPKATEADEYDEPDDYDVEPQRPQKAAPRPKKPTPPIKPKAEKTVKAKPTPARRPTKKSEPKPPRRTSKRRSSRGKKPIAILAGIVVLSLVFLFFTGRMNHVGEGLGIGAMKDDSELQEVKDAISVYASNPQNIVTDPTSKISYVDNELLVTANTGVTQAEVEAFASAHNGSVVGYNRYLGQYQILLSSEYSSLSSLEQVKEEYLSSGLFEESYPNYALNMTVDSAYYPSDSQWSPWEKNASKHWGADAIHAPEMWDLMSRIQQTTTNVGVLDGQFCTHEDLNYAGVYLNDYDPGDDKPSHGIHVSGIIAATHNNKGIAGVATNVNLYGASYNGLADLSNEQKKDAQGNTVAEFQAGITYLVCLQDCKVINVSMGTSWIAYEDAGFTYEQFTSGEYREACYESQVNTSVPIANSLKSLINKGYDFLIVAAACNDNDTYGLTGEALMGSTLTVISDEQIKQRIIVVGSASKDSEGNYYVSKFSNHGDRVDVIAPGDNILSAVRKHDIVIGHISLGFTRDAYEYQSGTSMATPQVTGVAAAMASVNPALSGPEIKAIICDTASWDNGGVGYRQDEFYHSDKYPMLNGYAAVVVAAERAGIDVDQLLSQPIIPGLSAFPTMGQISDAPRPTIASSFAAGDFSLVGSWESIGSYGFGQAQPGSTVTFDGTHCNFYSPYDTYSFYYQDGQWHLDCKNFLFGDVTEFTVEIVNNDYIKVDFDGSITELERVGTSGADQDQVVYGAESDLTSAPTAAIVETPIPTAIPTAVPTAIPTEVPTAAPTAEPTPVPTLAALSDDLEYRVEVTGDKVNVRNTPDKVGKLLKVTSSGHSFVLIAQPEYDNEGVAWYNIKNSSGETGWISSQFCKLVIAPKTTEPPVDYEDLDDIYDWVDDDEDEDFDFEEAFDNADNPDYWAGMDYPEDSDYYGTAQVVNCDSWVSLRSKPSKKASRVTKVPLGADVETYAYNDEFCLCYYQGKKGYILKKYLKLY